MIILISLLLIAILAILLLVQSSLFKEELITVSQLEPLEAGFESLKLGYSLSSPFFFLAILFVMFDLELLLLLPSVFLTTASNLIMNVSWILLMVFVLMSLLLEWSWCGLKWFI